MAKTSLQSHLPRSVFAYFSQIGIFHNYVKNQLIWGGGGKFEISIGMVPWLGLPMPKTSLQSHLPRGVFGHFSIFHNDVKNPAAQRGGVGGKFFNSIQILTLFFGPMPKTSFQNHLPMGFIVNFSELCLLPQYVNIRYIVSRSKGNKHIEKWDNS